MGTGASDQVEPSAVPDQDRLARALHAAARPLYRWLTRVRVVGADVVPSTGAVIVAANHLSFFDTVALIQSLPRRMFFLGKAEYMDSPVTRRLLPALGLIPIRRDQARQALAALEVAADVLRDGGALGIYPEGTRSRDGLLHRGHTGVAQLAIMTNAPIVPVGILGTDRIQPIGSRVPRPFRRAEVRFGRPIDPAAYRGSSRRRRQLLTDDLMEAIRRLSGQPVAEDFASEEPPLVRGGTETVYEVRIIGARAVSWSHAARLAVAEACREFDDGRVGTVRRLACAIAGDGTVRFDTDLAVSVKVDHHRSTARR